MQELATEKKAFKEALSAKNSPIVTEQPNEAAMEIDERADIEAFTDIRRKSPRQASPISCVTTVALTTENVNQQQFFPLPTRSANHNPFKRNLTYQDRPNNIIDTSNQPTTSQTTASTGPAPTLQTV